MHVKENSYPLATHILNLLIKYVASPDTTNMALHGKYSLHGQLHDVK